MCARALCVDGADAAARGERRLKHAKFTGAEEIGQVDQLESKARVGFIRAIARHRFLILEARQRQLDIDIQRFFEQDLEEAFVHDAHVFFFYKRHLDVDLCEVRLAIGTQVFIAEATGNLEIAIISREHEQLLKELRALRQREELARMHTAGHEVVARALRRALGENRGFDLEEILLIEVFTREKRDLMAHDEVFLHRWAAQIEITILQPQKLVCFAVVGDFKRCGFALAENLKLAHEHFQLAGWHVFVDHVTCSKHDFAAHSKHVFRADRAGTRKVRLAERIAVEDDLHQSCTVSELHKHQRTEIAPHVCPTHEDYFFACVILGKVCAVICSFPAAQ